MFQLDQVKASQQVFNQAFIEESKEVSEKLQKSDLYYFAIKYCNILCCKYRCFING